jgi:serine/threonine protein kinase
MPAPSTVEEFLVCVRQSGLIEPQRLQAYLKERLASGGVPSVPRRLAQDMLSDGLLTKFQAEQLLMGRYRKFEIGGKYRLLERVGEGGAAAVYLCEHLVLRRPVALKILPAWRTKSPEVVTRFLREARAAALVDHPNIVRVHDVEATDQGHFLVTEFVDGPNLESLVEARGPLDIARAAHYIRQAALALQHAHEAGMVHRDIKPSNFLVDRSGTLKLLDLGLVKLLQSDDGLTQSLAGKTVLGTIDFQAPEQAVDSSDVDIRADIYSLGATFHFLLTGQVIFPEGTVAQKLSWHQRRKPQPLRELRPEVPDKLARIIAKMLAKEPKDRYDEPQQIADALEPWTREPVAPLEEFELPKLSRAARGFLADWAKQRRTNTPMGAARPKPRPQASKEATASTVKQAVMDIWSQPRRRLAILGVLSAAVLLGGGWLVLTWLNKKEVPVSNATETPSVAGGQTSPANVADFHFPPPPASKTSGLAEDTETPFRVVSRSGSSRAANTLADALASVQPGDRIEVHAALIRESLDLTQRSGVLKGLELLGVGRDGAPVVWQPPQEQTADRPLLDLKGMESLTIKGFRLDGQGRVNTLIQVTGPAAGLILEELHCRGAAQPLALQDAWGSTDRPITLRSLRFQGAPGGEIAIRLQTTSADRASATRAVTVQLCRFEGPYQAAIAIAGPTRDLEIRECRFLGVEDGIRLIDTGTDSIFGARVSGNTFFDVQRGLHFETSPANGLPLIVENNLFANTAHLAMLDGIQLQPTTAPSPDSWVWCDEQPGSNVPVVERPFRKAFELASVPSRATLNISADESFQVWLNGQLVGHSASNHFNQRVHAFDVTLRPGRNVLAVLVANQADPFNPKGYNTAAGLMAQLKAVSPQGETILVQTDSSWKSSPSMAEGWQQAGFDDSGWKPVRVWRDAKIAGVTWPWSQTTWDSTLESQFRSGTRAIHLESDGNVRDYFSWEGYPVINASRAVLAKDLFSLKPDDDRRFLRYPPSHPLAQAGRGGVPVGLPEAD